MVIGARAGSDSSRAQQAQYKQMQLGQVGRLGHSGPRWFLLFLMCSKCFFNLSLTHVLCVALGLLWMHVLLDVRFLDSTVETL